MNTIGLKTRGLSAALVPVFVVIAASAACATTLGAVPGTPTTDALPWEGALGGLAVALTGTTAKIISIIAIFVAGVALIFGEDLGHFAKRLLMIVIAIAFLVGASSFVTTITSGAHV